MTLRDDLVAQGNWLFRNRSWIPLAALAALLAALPFAPAPLEGPGRLLWEGFCVSLSLAGLVVRAATVGCKPRGTSGRNRRVQNAQLLNTTGLYSIVRHPLYLGNALMWAGVVLYARTPWLAPAVGLAFWAVYERIVYAEEEFLRERFGGEFVAWAAVTPAFVPRPRNYRPAALPFSLRNVLRREYSGLFALVVLFTAEVLEWRRFATGRWHADPVWLPAAAASAVLYLTLRTLKRRTRLLHVEGR
jgi:protein-S-isoprenylcysteine O-methyltransferase Ste14